MENDEIEELKEENAWLREQICHLAEADKKKRVETLFRSVREAVTAWYVANTDYEPFVAVRFPPDEEVFGDGFHFEAGHMPTFATPLSTLAVIVDVRIEDRPVENPAPTDENADAETVVGAKLLSMDETTPWPGEKR
jgi:hypothetical protein